ncbi:unnamed protein product [Effrenium voratum]|uniref:Pentatricopeptide repeat-containing protein n=1 Tax=Effrenium voratum TaxID=2562239 RepID=A0AA36IVU1_9DINO|nr:unnamed protein product [Effrenium voratum]
MEAAARLRAAERSGDWPLALALVDLHPEKVAYHRAISACGRGRRWQLSLQMLRAMPRRQLRPDVISYNRVISACERTGEDGLEKMENNRLVLDSTQYFHVPV